MRITKITSQKNNNRVNVHIDGKFAFGLMKEIQLRHNLAEDMKISQDFINKILLEEERAKAKEVSLKFLSYRQRSEKEIVNKLVKEGFKEDIVENTLNYLKKYNLINDLEFAKSFVRDKINLNKYGPQRIKYDLYKKGIAQDIIDQVLVEDRDQEYERALELGKKRIKSYKNDSRQAQYRKLAGYLQRRGFSYEVVSKVLKELVK